MKCSLRLGSPSRRVALLAVVLAALAGCTTIREGRAGPGQRLDPWENWNRKVFDFNEGLDNAVLKPVATVYADIVPAAGAARRRQLLQQLRRRLVGDQQHAAGQVRRRLRGRHPGRHEHPVRPVRHPRRRDARWASSITTRTSARRSAARASAPAPTWCCRCWARRPCATRRRCRSTGSASPPAFFDGTGTQIGFTVLQIINTRAESARRDARDRRHRARQVHLHSRRLPAAAPQPGLRRRRPGDAGRARGGRLRPAGAAAEAARSGYRDARHGAAAWIARIGPAPCRARLDAAVIATSARATL